MGSFIFSFSQILWFFSGFLEKFQGVPLVYISILLIFVHYLFFYLKVNPFTFNKTVVGLDSLLFLLGIFGASFLTLFSTNYLFDSFKYFVLAISWIYLFLKLKSSFVSFNTSIDSFAKFFVFASSYLKVFCLVGLLSTLISFALVNPSLTNSCLISMGSNPNLMVYILMFFVFSFRVSRMVSWEFLSVALVILSGSRTGFLLVFIFYLNIIIIPFVRTFLFGFKFKRKLLSSFFVLILFIGLLLSVNPDFGRGKLTDSILDGFDATSVLIFDSDKVLDADFERVKLMQANKMLLSDRWPYGIGYGLKNYREYLRPYSNSIGVRPAKAHNFYISYSVEYGFFIIFVIIGLLLKILFGIVFVSSRYSLLVTSLLISCMFALLFNEYFLSPTVFLAALL